MEIIEIQAGDRRAMKQFLDLPFWLYRDTPQWTPPLRTEARQVFDRRKNPIFRYGEAAFFLALDGRGQARGRLAVMENRRYNEFNRLTAGFRPAAFFYLFECEDDPNLAGSLFEAACAWARRRGLQEMLGPKGFSPFDGMGLLVEGFEHRPALGIPYNLPYYVALLESIGFTPGEEILSGYLGTQAGMGLEAAQAEHTIERIHKLAQRVQQRRGLKFASFQRRKDLQAIVPRLAALYNLSIEGTRGNYPVSDEEASAIARQMLLFADPRLIKIVLKAHEPVGGSSTGAPPAGIGPEDEIIGFLFAYADISAALQRSRGRLLPLGWLWILLELRRREWLNVNGMGIVEEYRGLGGTAILFSELLRSAMALGYRQADIVQIGADNERMLRELESFGVSFYKKHRMYCIGLA